MGYYLNLLPVEGKTPDAKGKLEKEFLSFGCKNYFDKEYPDRNNFFLPVPAINSKVLINVIDEPARDYFASVRLSIGFDSLQLKAIVTELLRVGQLFPFQLHDPQLNYVVLPQTIDEYIEKIVVFNSRLANMLGKISPDSELN